MNEEKDKSIVTLQINVNVDIDKIKQFLSGVCGPILFKVMQTMQENKKDTGEKC